HNALAEEKPSVSRRTDGIDETTLRSGCGSEEHASSGRRSYTVSTESISPNRRENRVSASSHSRRPTLLSSREVEVLRLVVSGLPMKSVAWRLGITARTVAFHKSPAMRLLGLRGNADLIDYAIQNGLLGGKTFAASFGGPDADLAAPGE